jgi:hypothetical protein
MIVFINIVLSWSYSVIQHFIQFLLIMELMSRVEHGSSVELGSRIELESRAEMRSRFRAS